MSKFLLIILMSICSISKSDAQEKLNPSSEVNDAINIIKESICTQDTTALISLLEEFEKNYPKDGMVLFTNKILGDFYLALNQKDIALNKLQYAFNYKPTTKTIYLRSTDTDCKEFFYQLIPSESKADVCISLSNVFMVLEQYDSSLHYFKLAETKYMPYEGCGNGMIRYYSYVSPYLAETYLAMGDTTKAINRLLDYFLRPDGDMETVTKKLKEILLLKYSPSEVIVEVEKGLRNLKVLDNEGGYPARILEFELFGYTIKGDAYTYSSEHFKKHYKQHESIIALTH